MYDTAPSVLNESEAAFVKSILTDLPRAGSAGQAPEDVSKARIEMIKTYLVSMDYKQNKFVL